MRSARSLAAGENVGGDVALRERLAEVRADRVDHALGALVLLLLAADAAPVEREVLVVDVRGERVGDGLDDVEGEVRAPRGRVGLGEHRLQALEQLRVLDVDVSAAAGAERVEVAVEARAPARPAPRGRSGCGCGRCRGAPRRARCSSASRVSKASTAAPSPRRTPHVARAGRRCARRTPRAAPSRRSRRSRTRGPAARARPAMSHSRLRSVSSWSAVTPQPNSTKMPARCSAARSSRAAASSSGSIGSIPAASIASRSMPAAYASPSSRSSPSPGVVLGRLQQGPQLDLVAPADLLEGAPCAVPGRNRIGVEPAAVGVAVEVGAGIGG